MSDHDVMYDEGPPLRERTQKAVADETLRGNLRNSSASWGKGRQRVSEEFGFEEMKARAKEIRTGNIKQLPQLLDQLTERVIANGGRVIRAPDRETAAEYIVNLARQTGTRVVTKSKSMATEEIKLNEALEAAGVRVVETDLGEWILQLAHQRPAHIIAPAVHLNRSEVAELFRKESGEDIPDDREALVAYARRRLREDFAAAQIGVSGVNLGVAATGTLCIMENEGNARLVTALPPIHVAVMGAERVVADWDEAAHILQVLPMAAIGDDASTYVNLITGPRRDGETDGPKELHLIILDGGRLALRGTEFEEALNCIRCGACLYSCPMWRTVGGQAYGSPYSGPIGAVITPLLEGTSSPRASELPFLSSLCGACHEACPVGIPLHDLLVRIRGAVSTTPHKRQRHGARVWAAAWSRPRLYRAGRVITRVALRMTGKRGRWLHRLPGPAKHWTEQRDFPTSWPPR